MAKYNIKIFFKFAGTNQDMIILQNEMKTTLSNICFCTAAKRIHLDMIGKANSAHIIGLV